MSAFVFQVDAVATCEWVVGEERPDRLAYGGRNNSAFVDPATKTPLQSGWFSVAFRLSPEAGNPKQVDLMFLVPELLRDCLRPGALLLLGDGPYRPVAYCTILRVRYTWQESELLGGTPPSDA